MELQWLQTFLLCFADVKRNGENAKRKSKEVSQDWLPTLLLGANKGIKIEL